jgi:hypothetical protein
MHISKLSFVVFCFVPNSGFAIQMRWDEDFLPREPENVYAGRKNVDGSRRQMRARRYFCFSQAAETVAESVFHPVTQQPGSGPGSPG